ncbi:radical SAM/CxCxxxxC motif protein YfkAB [Paenibacillus sp. 19GGS1-52]|uniref:radical SAM/CxCxxxxC motif protein YfkAB n=1 Tax=Paenibacillus sp. 19GGS1-52 TaxID=2758563 RepID=UPI001EFB09EF|nr:radical SAM/CxCxxxxC motif protein YfkAB [Paenibacillus sp. 19GGS1-52]ULO05937.1 radical SAM/CxCxxxxC motif protein YfkAB [Paenibacillus sp. 19GGS1-52]
MNVIRSSSIKELSPSYDPWDPITSLRQQGRHVLTSVEMTVTNLCNMRCEHCAVGDALTAKEGEMLPLKQMLDRLEEVEHLQTISITGGEPMFRAETVKNTIVPLLKYAKERGLKSQINSNLTMPYSRYELLLPYLDVMHISFNYVNGDDFHEVGFANSGHSVSKPAAYRVYDTMIENSRRLSSDGMFISAETMINYRTHTKLPEIHQLIRNMGAKRHEVHPMYATSFASALPVLSLPEMAAAIHDLLDNRDPEMWMLFGTLPFFACSSLEEDQMLLRRLRTEQNVTLRNDPDGRNRVNVNLFTGDVFVTDFADIAAFGNIAGRKLDDIFIEWQTKHPLNQLVNCHCDAASCCGPNLLVADMYYPNVDFKARKAITL